MTDCALPFRSRLLSAAALALLALGGCTSSAVDGRPLAELSFTDMPPVYVSAADIHVTDNYVPAADPQDVSSRLPTPPDIAVRRYAETRLRPGGGVGVLNLVIENSTVHAQPVAADTTIERWTGTGTSTQYDATLRVSFSKQSDTRQAETSHAVDVSRSVTIPDSYSIAEREETLQAFTRNIVTDVDKAVVTALQAENLVMVSPQIPPVLAAPEMGRE
jgi:hypothetical protein